VQRYIRLTHLIPEWLLRVDGDALPICVGASLSHMDAASQKAVYDYYKTVRKGKLDLKTCEIIRNCFKMKNGVLNAADLENLLIRKKKANRAKPFTINRKKLNAIVKNLPDDATLEALIIAFLRERFVNNP
jgi:hypothetical protein